MELSYMNSNYTKGFVQYVHSNLVCNQQRYWQGTGMTLTGPLGARSLDKDKCSWANLFERISI